MSRRVWVRMRATGPVLVADRWTDEAIEDDPFGFNDAIEEAVADDPDTLSWEVDDAAPEAGA